MDRTARPITGVEGRGDSGVTASAHGVSPPGRRSAAIVGGPGDAFRAREAPAPAPPAPSVRHATDASAVARRLGEKHENQTNFFSNKLTHLVVVHAIVVISFACCISWWCFLLDLCVAPLQWGNIISLMIYFCL
jgi:hypothetical protein